jgi:hypothetical protein
MCRVRISAVARLARAGSERQAREHVFEQAISRREPRFGELADDLSGRRDQLGSAAEAPAALLAPRAPPSAPRAAAFFAPSAPVLAEPPAPLLACVRLADVRPAFERVAAALLGVRVLGLEAAGACPLAALAVAALGVSAALPLRAAARCRHERCGRVRGSCERIPGSSLPARPRPLRVVRAPRSPSLGGLMRTSLLNAACERPTNGPQPRRNALA